MGPKTVTGAGDLLLGMNAHINRDLAFVLAGTGLIHPDGSSSKADYDAVEEWLFWQVGGIGPMAGQAHHFLRYAPSMDPPQVLPYAQSRYRREVGRLYGVLDKRLAGRDYVAGDYSIADIATIGWVNALSAFYAAEDILGLDDYANVQAWLARALARPAVQRGLHIPAKPA